MWRDDCGKLGAQGGHRRRAAIEQAIMSSVIVAACAVLRQHWLAHLPSHPVSRPHCRCVAGPEVEQRSCFIPKW